MLNGLKMNGFKQLTILLKLKGRYFNQKIRGALDLTELYGKSTLLRHLATWSGLAFT